LSATKIVRHPLDLARRGWARVRIAFEVLLPCRFAILVLLVITAAFVVVDQGSESLRVLAEFGDPSQVGAREPYVVRLVLFLAGATALASSAWYCSRQALLIEPPRKPVSKEAQILFTWAPRVLGALGFACAALALWIAADQYGSHSGIDQVPSPRLLLRILAVIFLLLGIGFGALLTRRRSLLGIEDLAIPDSRGRFRELPAGTKTVLRASGLATLLLFVAIVAAPIRLTSFVATPTVLLFCSAIWVFAGTVLVVAAARLELPLFTILLALLLVSSFWNDNHRVRAVGPARARPSLAQSVQKWVSWMDDNYPGEKVHPVFLVAAEGGGLRAAYWTAAVLSAIHTQFPTFSDHLFAVSAVSGGSFGAAVFEGLLAARPEDFRKAARDILSHDFLAPTTARLLGCDLPQQFLPPPILPDRGAAMERAFERAWRKVEAGTFARPFLEFALGHEPALFLNATEVETGRRIIFSPARIGFPEGRPDPSAEFFENAGDGIDLLGGDLALSGAVHMSARFTYVSPAATIESRGTVHRIVDGGYFENSGAATADDILEYLHSPQNPSRARLAPHVILITHTEKPIPGGEALSEMLAPVRAIFAARVARGDQAVAELRGEADGRWTEFNLRTDQGVPLPLGWLLSAQARRAIDEAIDSPANRAARSEIGSLLTREPRDSRRNTIPDRLSQTARKKEAPQTVGGALRRIVQGR
jgi:predicted acylesterase/phospholipase RssA